jgi:small-conductance mechanosensitive channel/CRP-like cAMP-binding protein
MWLWENLKETSGLGGGLLWLCLIFCAAAILLATALPLDRTRVRAAVTLYILSIVGLFVATILPGDHSQNIYYLWTRIISLFLMSVAIVTVAGVVVFDIFLLWLGLRPAAILCDLILAVSYIAAALLLLSHVGVNVSGIVATSAVVTAVIGFSLQDTLGNVMGGMAIQMERTITVGDWIRVNENVGIVREIRWRQTSIETRNWDTVVIPNGVLMKSNVVVLGRKTGSPRQHRQYVYFNVDYRHPPTEVIAAVNEAVSTDTLANTAADPAPHCLLMDFKDSYASYAVRYWLTDLAQDEKTDSLMRCRIVFALKRNGISAAIPATRTFQTNDDAELRARIIAEGLERRVAALGRVDLFAPLNDDERRHLAERLRESPFAQGELMARQGDDSPCLYIITKGQAEVRLGVQGAAAQRTLAMLTAGQFFGEMGLLTGDVRSATVLAMSDVHCLRLDKEDFMDVLKRRPQIAEAISEILAERRMELEAARDHLTGEAVKERLRKTQGDLLARIRKFFTL